MLLNRGLQSYPQRVSAAASFPSNQTKIRPDSTRLIGSSLSPVSYQACLQLSWNKACSYTIPLQIWLKTPLLDQLGFGDSRKTPNFKRSEGDNPLLKRKNKDRLIQREQGQLWRISDGSVINTYMKFRMWKRFTGQRDHDLDNDYFPCSEAW